MNYIQKRARALDDTLSEIKEINEMHGFDARFVLDKSQWDSDHFVTILANVDGHFERHKETISTESDAFDIWRRLTALAGLYQAKKSRCRCGEDA